MENAPSRLLFRRESNSNSLYMLGMNAAKEPAANDGTSNMDILVEIEVQDLTDDIPVSQPIALSDIVKIISPALVVAACGGEGSPSPPTGGIITPPPPPPSPPPVTGIQASRFLAQATMGPNKADIVKVQAQGYDAWITEQFALARPISHWDWMVGAGFNAAANVNTQNGFNPTMWRQLISSPDQLRQRVGMALLDFLVISIDGITSGWNAFTAAAYVDILLDNAFGNYRTLLEQISTNSGMGLYLTFLGNRKANPATGSMPDENYARELMQLFTLGVSRLNADGTAQTSGTATIDSYTQEDVTGLARVFTGFTLDSSDNSTPDRYRRPMIVNAGNHELGTKTFLGSTIAAGTGGMASLTAALDTIFAHPNLPPFVSKQLIQRLVTSNPSPAYVARVSAVFINNGSNGRGDMKAVIRAILLDVEARDPAGLTSTTFGKLRAPVNRLTNWARAFGVTSATDTWAFGNTASSANRLAQSPARSPSVFNFFRPGYIPPNTELSVRTLVGPEFQITTEPSVIAYINYMQSLISGGAGDARGNYTDFLALAANSQSLVDEANLVLAAGQISAQTIATIKAAVDSIAATDTVNRTYVAILLVMASPEYIVQK